ncbi:MAG TPA: alpha-hydroxy-acid oxidizing protein [Terriglobales bacterium]|nr:alpha-hydroxy-acid oxidizing protein [Terriglobales bacterium]
MNYKELMESARSGMGAYCKACVECNGKACKAVFPGPGALGSGDVAVRNFDKWKEIRLHMDTIHEDRPVDIRATLCGRDFEVPFYAGPTGGIKMHYGEKYDDVSYNTVMVETCAAAGTVAFTNDTIDNSIEGIKKAGGIGIPAMIPYDFDMMERRIARIHESGAYAMAIAIDSQGLPYFKKNHEAKFITAEQLAEVIKMADMPVIVKGIMTPKGAAKAIEAGATAIVVSNHGGRVLDQCMATAEVLPDIVSAVAGAVPVLVDGGIRSGADIFKAFALGAKGVLICRPFVTAVYGGGADGIRFYIEKLADELKSAMWMCGAFTLSEISRDMVYVP